MRNIVLVLTVATVTPLLAQSSSYHITHTYKLGGDGGWDYIVPDPRNLYVDGDRARSGDTLTVGSRSHKE